MHKDAMRNVSPHRRCHGKGGGGVVRARSSVERGSHSRTNHLARLGAEDRHDAHGSCGNGGIHTAHMLRWRHAPMGVGWEVDCLPTAGPYRYVDISLG